MTRYCLLAALLLGVLCPASYGQMTSRGTVTVPVTKIEDQIRGGMLGHIIGDLNGLKHELKYIAEPGNVQAYVPELSDGAWTDDDTDIEWIYVVEMERSRQLRIPYPRVAELWKRHINRRIWCSHQYLRQMIDLGIQPPLTGSALLNPWAEFNLSGQFVSESFGLISPGMPQTAARTGTYYTHVSIEGEPIQSTQLFTAMIATAFLTDDIDKILDAGIAATDPASKLHQSALDARRFYRENPQDWRATRRLLKEKYMYHGGNDWRDRNGVLLNSSAVVAALLYGQGNFTETLRHAFNFGWDADNNAAAAGAIVGVTKGYKWLMGQGWNIKDQFRNTSRDEMMMDETISSFSQRLIALAEQNIIEQGGRKSVSDGQPVYHIRTESPALLEKLSDRVAREPGLRARLQKEIESAIAAASESQSLARSAYLAICLDLAPVLRQKHPEGWAKSIEALSKYPGMLHEIFYNQVTPDSPISRKAIEAGLVKPARVERK